MDGRTDGWMNGWMDRQMDGVTYGWTVGRVKPLLESGDVCSIGESLVC